MTQVRFDTVVARGWRAYADALRRIRRQGEATSALRSFGHPPRSDLSAWNQLTAQHFERYRSDHAPIARSVAVVCVSRRPHLLEAVTRNVSRQRGVAIELVFVANDPGFDGLDIASQFSHVDAVTVLIADPSMTLGAGLNMGIAVTDARFIAKFDDDDVYGPDYLVDSLRAHAFAGAAVVGKHSYYADVASTGHRYLRFGGHDFSYSSTLAGGTLVFDRERTGDLEFDDLSLGEDRSFISKCHRRGLSTFSADRFNFVQSRGGDNTWRISDERFLDGCVLVDATSGTHLVER